MTKKTSKAFNVLGVTPEDDMTTIRMAWRRKVRLLHPDQASDKVAATAELAEVNAAFDALQGHVPKRKSKADRPKREPRTAAPERPRSPGKARAPHAPNAEAKRPRPRVQLSPEKQARLRRAVSGYVKARAFVSAA